MGKKILRPTTLLYPVPAVLVVCGDMEKANAITVAWTGTICSTPPMTYVSIRKERFSYEIIKEKMEYTINILPKKYCREVDFCGITSGRDIDKFEKTGLTLEPSPHIQTPSIKEAIITLECKVTKIEDLGSHDMFLGKIEGVLAAPEQTAGASAKFDPEIEFAYIQGAYYEIGKEIGKFGFSKK